MALTCEPIFISGLCKWELAVYLSVSELMMLRRNKLGGLGGMLPLKKIDFQNLGNAI